jgi:drug/metabolite transporter (DMT)-like permease
MFTSKYRGEVILLLVTLIWGATFAIIKNALVSISPMMFLTFRFSIALLILLPFWGKIKRHLSKELLIPGFILGLSYFFGFASQTAGLKFTSATKSAFITGTFILYIPLFQLLLEKRAPGRGSIIGVILVLCGLIILSSRGDSLFAIFTEIGSGFNTGDFLTMLCAFNYGFYVVYLDKVTKQFDFFPVVFMQVAVTAAGAVLFAVVFNAAGIEKPVFTFNGDVIFALFYTSVLSTVLTTSLQTKYQKTTTPTKAGIIFSFEPIFASILAFFMLHEKISNFGLLGCILIFSGLLASELIDKREV